MPNTWTNFERDNNMALREQEKRQKEVILCNGCGCKFFQEIEVRRYRADHNIVIGQKVPPAANYNTSYMLLQCVRCGDYTEPNVDSDFTHNLAATGYHEFTDTLEGKGDTREKKEDLVLLLDKLQKRVDELEAKLETDKPKGKAKKNAVPDKE